MSRATINQSGLNIVAEDEQHNILIGFGTSVPTGPGYSQGALFIDTDSGAAYINEGTNVSATFAVIQAFAQGAALTAQLTTITHTAAGTADYALQDLVQNTGFGFATADEGNTLLAVVANLQTRLAEVEARLEAAGLVAAN